MLRVGELGKTLQIDRRPHGDVLVVDRLPVDVTIGAAHVLHAQKKAERHDGRCRDPAQAQEPPLPAGSMPEGLHPLGQAFPGKSVHAAEHRPGIAQTGIRFPLPEISLQFLLFGIGKY